MTVFYERALDFDNIWGIEEGVTYPFLQWQVDTTPPVITIDMPTETILSTGINCAFYWQGLRADLYRVSHLLV